MKKTAKQKIFWMSEKVFLKYVKDAFEFDDHLQLHRRNVGTTKTKSGRFVKFGEAGQADLFGTLKKWTCPDCGRTREGITIEIEVKGIYKNGKRGVHSPAQKKWQAEVERNNGIYLLLYPVETDPIGLRVRVWRLIVRKFHEQCCGREKGERL